MNSSQKSIGDIFAFSGTHGIGKTTEAFAYAARLKEEHHDKRIHVLSDIEAFCPFPINKDTSPEAQLWIFSSMLNETLEAVRLVDLLVTDRTLVDVAAYTVAAGFDGLAKSMMSVIEETIGMYDKIFVKQIDTASFPLVSDSIRDTDKEFQQEVEDIIKELYEDLFIGEYLTGELVYV